MFESFIPVERDARGHTESRDFIFSSQEGSITDNRMSWKLTTHSQDGSSGQCVAVLQRPERHEELRSLYDLARFSRTLSIDREIFPESIGYYFQYGSVAENRCISHSQCLESNPQQLGRRQQLRSLYASPLYKLPPELILAIFDNIPWVDYTITILMLFHLLRYKDIVPHLPPEQENELRQHLLLPEPLLHPRHVYKGSKTRPIVHMIFGECWGILQYLSSQDKVNLVIAYNS